MEKHVNSVCRSCYLQLRQISQIRRHITQDATKTLIHSFVISRLDNLNSMLYGTPQSLRNKIQKIQNHAARLVLGLRKSDHITQALFELHWLPVDRRIDYKLLTLTHKAIHKIAPSYLQEMIEIHIPQRPLRSGDEYLLSIKLFTSQSKKYGDRTFAYAAPELWNNLPKELRKLGMTNENSKTFKAHLKTHLFKCAFDNLI